MKITIDTKEDNKEELKRLINLLQALVNEPSYSSAGSNNDVFEQEGTSGMNAFASMFGGSNNSSESSTESKESSYGESSYLEENKEEESVAKRIKKGLEIVPY